MNQKKLRRLYKEEGLAVKRRRGRKRATGTREPMPVPDGPSKGVVSGTGVETVKSGV